MIGNADSRSFSHSCSIPATVLEVPKNAPSVDIAGVTLCQWAECEACAGGPEAAFAHPACLRLFRKAWTASEPAQALMDRAWLTAAWSYPWRHAPHLRLNRPNVLIRVPPLVAGGLGMHQLARLPVEIVQTIRCYSASSLLWRYLCLEHYANENARVKHSPWVRMPIKEVRGWRRGGELVRMSRVESEQSDATGSLNVDEEGPVVRVTVDWRGIRQIERLSKEFRHAPQQNSDYQEVFMILRADALDGTVIHFKVRWLQLTTQRRLTQDRMDLPVSNTLKPAPNVLVKVVNGLPRFGTRRCRQISITNVSFCPPTFPESAQHGLARSIWIQRV